MAPAADGWNLARQSRHSEHLIRGQMYNNDEAQPRLSTKRVTHTKIVQSRQSEYGIATTEDIGQRLRSKSGSVHVHRRSIVGSLFRRKSRYSDPTPTPHADERNEKSQTSAGYDAARASHTRSHHQYFPLHHQHHHHDDHDDHHHHHHEPEPSQELLYLIPRAVIVQFGPYTFHGVTDFRVERLQGLQNVLQKMGATVKMVANTDYRNRVMVWYMDAVIFACKVTDLIHGGDGELDPFCIHAAHAFDHACRKSIHGLRNRVMLDSDDTDAMHGDSRVIHASDKIKFGETHSDDDEEDENNEIKLPEKKALTEVEEEEGTETSEGNEHHSKKKKGSSKKSAHEGDGHSGESAHRGKGHSSEGAYEEVRKL